MYKIESNPENRVEAFYSVFDPKDSNNRGWSVTEVYSGATVFCDSGNCPTKQDYKTALVCDPREGAGAELSNLIGMHFSFDDAYDDVEKTEIRNNWLSSRYSMLTSDKWHIEEEYIKIPGGFTVDLVRINGTNCYDVIEKNITLCNFKD